VLGIPHAVFLALLTGLLETIPMIGPIAAAVIAGPVAVRYATGIGPIIAYTVYAIALRVSIDQILAPIVLGSAARVHPVVIIFCFLAGGVLFGIVGIILAVPAALVVRTSLAILYDEPREAPGVNSLGGGVDDFSGGKIAQLWPPICLGGPGRTIRMWDRRISTRSRRVHGN
jgi:predicted PurR-regulated permease PerM